jgi:hypothetical protein
MIFALFREMRWNPTNACKQHACLTTSLCGTKERKEEKINAFAPMLYATLSLAQAAEAGEKWTTRQA